MADSQSPGRLAFFTGLAAAAAFAIGPLVAYGEVVPPMTGFILFALGILLALVTIVLALVSVVRGRRSGALWLGLLLALAVVGVTFGIVSRRGNFPRINDITTDTQNAPRFTHAQTLPENQGRDMSYPGEDFARQQREGYGEITGLRLPLPPDQAFARVQLAARGVPGWKLTQEDMQGRRLEGYETSNLFRFRDDFVIEVRPDGDASIVHMRSKSRDGQGDLGVNAKRIQEFFARLK